jgi:heme exporter protein CcmD
MSGHGIYVWIAVFFSLTMLIALILFPLYVHAKVSKEARIDQHKTTAPLGGEGSG